ncbi:MAG: type II toxin-antitoxin system VapC family toxin [Bifidobacteriaceae bacterium]|jgi:predicted nucleic acid-binding protein|nr:type II toxin-antitoxin system VapC family toxin [Bifidobacteriaceae bacterium]
MYLLDTNVLSELRKITADRCDPGVAEWTSGVDQFACFLSAITVKELEYGVGMKERRDPRQGAGLRRWLDQLLNDWRRSVSVVDAAIARRAARLHLPDPAPEADAYLAATALERGLTMVTRNTANFRRFDGLRLANPWSDAQPEVQRGLGG